MKAKFSNHFLQSHSNRLKDMQLHAYSNKKRLLFGSFVNSISNRFVISSWNCLNIFEKVDYFSSREEKCQPSLAGSSPVIAHYPYRKSKRLLFSLKFVMDHNEV